MVKRTNRVVWSMIGVLTVVLLGGAVFGLHRAYEFRLEREGATIYHGGLGPSNAPDRAYGVKLGNVWLVWAPRGR